MHYYSIIPKNMQVTTQTGENKRVLLIDNRGVYPNGKIGLDCYYSSNHAVFKLMKPKDYKDIPFTKKGVSIDLYKRVFHK
jgi:hypothetical protein